ncbi:MAG: hypothetical protein WC437_02090 [Patescibacteria group bacterium]|jgi:hypothetical protein|nr:hypothetical protein [Patescibacteria group bacterium]
MLATTHVLVGAGAGEVVHNPSLAFVVSIILHFLTDKIPHYWPKSQKQKNILVFVDWSIALLIIIFLLIMPTPNKTSVIAGAIASLLVDLLLVGVPALHKTKIGLWHTNRQPHRTEFYFLLTDLVFIIPLSVYFLAEVI